jgi:hypothetical protein
VSEHPLQALTQELLVHQLCQELAVEALSDVDVAAYLTAESPGGSLPAGLAELVYRHSEGNPLFMRAVLDHLTQQGILAQQADAWDVRVPLADIALEVPESLRQMLDAQLGRLSPEEQRMLEVASVTGAEFTAHVSAVAANLESEPFEALCETLVRRQSMVRTASVQHFPDGHVSQRYAFVHALYREVCYGQVAPMRRATLHRRIGERVEALYAAQRNEVAAELAYHFEAGAEWARAVQYLRLVADTAGRRYAPREAVTLLEHALALVRRLPEAERAMREIELLEQLATLYLVSYDQRALDTYEALAARAARDGLVDVEMRALIDMAYPLSWSSAQRCLDVVARALQLRTRQGDPLLRARTWISGVFWRVAFGAWQTQEVDACRQALAEIRRAGDRRVLARHLLDYSHIQWVSSAYRDAQQSAVEGLALLAEGGEANPYLSHAHLLGLYVLPWSLLFLGEWGEALRAIDAGRTLGEKNGDERRAQTLHLYRAWVHFHAMDFAGVVAICASAFPAAGASARPSVLRFCQVLAGAAETALGHHGRALEHLQTAREAMERQMVIFDWYRRMPLELAFTNLRLATGDLPQARPQAARLLDVTLATAERTWQALAWDANARVARAAHDLERAHACIAQALATMEGIEVPLAAWRVHATAAELHELTSNNGMAAHHRALSRATILQLAQSLPADAPLRNTFLSAPAVAKVLGDAVCISRSP